MSLIFLSISLIGVNGRKKENIKLGSIVGVMSSGIILYFGSILCLYLPLENNAIGSSYMSITLIAFLMVLARGTWISRHIKNELATDIFNTENETFPQEERLLENEYSVNLPSQYRLNGRPRKSWINFVNLFRGLLVAGTPGSGKSYFVIRTNETESEEFHKNLVSDFLKRTYYEPNHFINTKGRNDLVIHNGDKAQTSVGVIIEAKKPTNRSEMVSTAKLNNKAFQELVLWWAESFFYFKTQPKLVFHSFFRFE